MLVVALFRVLPEAGVSAVVVEGDAFEPLLLGLEAARNGLLELAPLDEHLLELVVVHHVEARDRGALVQGVRDVLHSPLEALHLVSSKSCWG